VRVEEHGEAQPPPEIRRHQNCHGKSTDDEAGNHDLTAVPRAVVIWISPSFEVHTDLPRWVAIG